MKLDSRVSREDLLKSFNQDMEFDEDSVIHQASQTLDEMMKVMFDLCQSKCRSDWEVHRSFYYDMYSTFESLILPAVGIHHAHFLMYFVCSTKPALYEAFIERLWNMFQNPSSPLNVRKSSADYLASFLGKATFVPMKYVLLSKIDNISTKFQLFFARILGLSCFAWRGSVSGSTHTSIDK